MALNKIIEKSLLNDQVKILEYFNILEKSNFPDDQKDLISFKKALYLIKELKVQEGKKILQELINKDSNLKIIAKELVEKIKLMNFLYVILISFLFINCSFDNKTGIWTNKDKKKVNNKTFSRF